MSKVYNLKKKDNFFSFIPRSYDKIIYTTLINTIIDFVVDFFFVEEKKMKGIFLREKKDKRNIKYEIIILLSLIKKRYISFIIFAFIINIISLYYLICFNSVYPYIQIEWIKITIFIIIIRQIISFFQCLLETILRFLSFRYENEKIFKKRKLVN